MNNKMFSKPSNKKNSVSISIIVPTLNEEKYIEKCLKSLKKQNFQGKYEIIVSDAYSSDKTVEIAKKYADKIVFTKKRTSGSGRNNGAKYSQGKYLIFVDADTCLPPNYLTEAYAIFKKNEFVGFSGSFKFDETALKYKLISFFTNIFFKRKSKEGLAILPGFNLCVPKQVFQKIGGFEDVFVEDAYFSEKLRKIGKTKYFSQFYAITSARRIKAKGMFNTFFYYWNCNKNGKKIYFDDKYEKIN